MIAYLTSIGAELDVSFIEKVLTGSFHFIEAVEEMETLHFETLLMPDYAEFLEEPLPERYDYEELGEAVDEVAFFKGYQMLVGFVRGYLIEIIPEYSESPYCTDGCHLHRAVLLSAETPVFHRKKVLEHEVGHFIGLGHHDNCLMQTGVHDFPFCTSCSNKIKNFRM